MSKSESLHPELKDRLDRLNSLIEFQTERENARTERSDFVRELIHDLRRKSKLDGPLLAEKERRLYQKLNREEAKVLDEDKDKFLESQRPDDILDEWIAKRIRPSTPLRHFDSGLPPSVDWLRQLWELRHSGPELTPPAIGCGPSNPNSNANCNKLIGEINLKTSVVGTGSGVGFDPNITKRAVSTGHLQFVYWPVKSGSLYVTPAVDISGTVYVAAHDHLLTSTDARLWLTLECSIFQSYWDRGPRLTVVEEHHWDSSDGYWLVDTVFPNASSTVVAQESVLISITATITAEARSDHALVDADFFTGAEKFIRVPQISVAMLPI